MPTHLSLVYPFVTHHENVQKFLIIIIPSLEAKIQSEVIVLLHMYYWLL